MNDTGRVFTSLGSAGAALGIILDAAGVHLLAGRLGAPALNAFQTACRYQIYHSLGLILVGLLCTPLGGSRLVRSAGWCMAGGMVLFSGSLYLLSAGGPAWTGIMTPLGGLTLILSWGLLCAATLGGAPARPGECANNGEKGGNPVNPVPHQGPRGPDH